MRYAFLDLETTGFEPSKDSIIEVSLVVEQDGQEVGRLDRVVVPDKSPLSDFVSQLTGIKQAEIDQNGVFFTEIKDEVETLLQDTVIVGHNIDFDINFLIGNGVDLAAHQRLDTHELARILLPQESSYALEVLTQNYGFAHESAHRAMSDVLASKDLFNLLLKKIDQLPRPWLDQIDTFLRDQTNWYARELFLAAPGGGGVLAREATAYPAVPTADQAVEWSQALTEQSNVFVRVGDTRTATNALAATAQALADQGQSVCLVTPKLDYFPYFPSLPTPGVLFDAPRCVEFVARRGGCLDDGQTTFYLKCLYRHFLGYRGLWHFDLFFKERDWWNEVCAQDVSAEVFASTVQEKAKESVLTCSPAAWAQLRDHAVLKDRVVLVDEAELSGEAWLKAPVKRLDFGPLLHSPQESVAQSTQFFIHRFVRDFVEPSLGKTFGTFPERLLLNFKDQLDRFESDLEQLLPAEQKDFWLSWLRPLDEKLVRWVIYAPESGNLSFYAWHPEDWRNLKAALHRPRKLSLWRHNLEGNDRSFARVFLGEVEGPLLDMRDTENSPKLVVPSGLVSQASPDFNASCADRIVRIFAESEHGVAANFSGLEALRTTYDLLRPSIKDGQFLAAEKVMGGDGKLLEKLQQHGADKKLLLFQKLLTPELEQYQWSDLVLQKFPFGPPDPLLQKLETTMKQSGLNWWNTWVMPRLTATLSRKIGQFPNLKTVHFLDPRENSKWGKAVLRDLFR